MSRSRKEDKVRCGQVRRQLFAHTQELRSIIRIMTGSAQIMTGRIM